MGQSVFDGLTEQAGSVLEDAASKVRCAQLEVVRAWQFDVSTLPPLDLPREVEQIKEVAQWARRGIRCLYYFSCQSLNFDVGLVRSFFKEAKGKGGARAYPQLNKVTDTQTRDGKSVCFYVGSSESMADRLRQHLGYGPARTYALHLIHWAKDLPTMEVNFTCARYAKDTSPEVMQVLEDTLWKNLKPMFGRVGAR
jgi:hypothetical protein